MKTGFNLQAKEYFWNSLRKITNTFSYLTVNYLGNGYIKCFWEISPVDNLRIKFSKSCFYGIRLFDISNNRSKNNSTCIMKEIQVSKFQSSISFPVPIDKGVYCFELGYRKKNGQWRQLSSQYLNLGYRIRKVIDNADKHNWFNSKKATESTELSLHEQAYQLSFNTITGGSEKIIENRKN